MIGTTVSHYKIIDKIGQGGMGVVYKAEDTKLQRPVALKFLPAEWKYSAEAKARFLQEARAASALDHPNICTIYEIGETADSAPFIAMAFYEGESLKERIEKNPLGIEEAVAVLLPITVGIGKAHEKGIFHRDLKPANIFITTDGVVKILDFGLAKLAGAARLSKSGSTPGTIAYMAPEQVQGGTVDHRADIWSLGVILFEMLTRQLPFDGEFEQSMMYAIVHKQAKSVKDFRNDVSELLEAVIDRALTKDPARRYQDISTLRSDLTRFNDSSHSSRRETFKMVSRESDFSLPKIPLKRSLIFISVTLTTIVISLFPLKIWRTTILYREKVLYIPTQALLPSQTQEKAELNIAVILPEDHGSIIDIAGKIKYPEILSCKNSAPEKLKSLQPYLDQLQIRHYWKKATLIDKIAEGFLDRIDDFPFWSTLGITINAWLLLSCVTQLKKNYKSCYNAASMVPKTLYILWILIGLLAILVPAYNQKVKAHGVIHGAFWTANFLPGVKTTQIVDFILYCIVSTAASYLLLIKIHLVRTMSSAKFRGLFQENDYLHSWEYLLNSGYFTFLFVSAILILIGTFFQERMIGWDKVNYVTQSFVFHLPFLVVTLIAWSLTRYRMDYKLAQVPFFVFWISVGKRID